MSLFKWVLELNGATVSVLINGSPTKEFRMERGLRQGDQMSPFLFLIVAEALHVLVLEACDKKIYNGLFLDEDKSNVSLLQYADEVLFFSEWSKANIRCLLLILEAFHEASGLKINIQKSRIFGIGVLPCEVEEVARSFGCNPDSIPFNYLGLPVGKFMNKVNGWKDVIDRF